MMRPGTDVADKAVSTADLQVGYPRNGDEAKKETTVTNTARELVRLEAVLAALVESKVIAIKAASGKASKKSRNQGKLERLTSTSTASSTRPEPLQNPPAESSSPLTNPTHHQSHQHYSHHHHHHHHHHKRNRQPDSALLSSGLLFPKKRYRGHHHIRVHDSDHHHKDSIDMPFHCEDCKQFANENATVYEEEGGAELRTKSATNLCGVEVGSRLSLEEQVPVQSTSCHGTPFLSGYHNYDYSPPPRQHHGHIGETSSCCHSPTHSQSKILVPRLEGDHVSLNIPSEEEEEEAAKRRKRKRRRKHRLRNENSDQVGTKRVKRIDPEDLPKRARWTIIATACLLLLMSVLLVGVTLRMAPIIDEIVRKENEQLMNSLNHEESMEKLYNVSVTTSTASSTQSNHTPAPN